MSQALGWGWGVMVINAFSWVLGSSGSDQETHKKQTQCYHLCERSSWRKTVLAGLRAVGTGH